ncbi:DUF3365 domain-containing protein [bacterium]|nr:DUF3365 domain-containing protein [bacterium]MBU1883476.1 DUF3365 domain-containing protein [bacterium]
MKTTKIVSITLLCSSLLLAQTQKQHDEEIKSIVKDGQIATKTLLQTLQKNMKQHIKQGGITDALSFCSNEAYALTDKVNANLKKGISAKRISAKYRNPANAPLDDEMKVLDSIQTLKSEKKKVPPYILKQIDEHTYKLYTPLVINKPVCLKCHGDIAANPALQKEISSRYPDDKAVDYKMGDLRGAVVVTIKR